MPENFNMSSGKTMHYEKKIMETMPIKTINSQLTLTDQERD